ncbi:MAG: tetratricopeptide repeat protein [Planctomycetota bacterium]
MKKGIYWTLAVACTATGCITGGVPMGSARTAHGPSHQSRMVHDELNWEQKLVRGMNPFSESAPSRPAPQPQYDPLELKNGYGQSSPEMFIEMAKLADRGGNLDQARQMYGKALAATPGNLDALLGLARLEDRAGNLDEAMRIYRQTVALHPANATAYNDLALCQARRGEMQESLYLLQQATQLDPGKALYRNNLAKVLAEIGRPNDALSELSTVLPPAAARYNLAYMLHERGRTAEAVGYLQSALAIDPTLTAATELLATIRSGGEQLATNEAQQPQVDNSILPTPSVPAAEGSSQPSFPSTGMHTPLTGPVMVPGVASKTSLSNPPTDLPPQQ